MGFALLDNGHLAVVQAIVLACKGFTTVAFFLVESFIGALVNVIY